MKAEDLTKEKVAELKQKHGNDLRVIDAPNGDIVVIHKPSKFTWARWTSHINDEKRDRSQTVRDLVNGCLAAPEESVASALFDEYPVMPSAISDVIAEMGGGVIEPKKI
jgi:hypothetical protein